MMMMGALSQGLRARLWGANAAALLGLSLVCAAAIGPAEADKVGVAAAVNPDAFSSLAGSPQSQLSIGKSIFYNERINTTGNGLVQVLLVDGSTFTVGPGSDLVIDKFVYDPKKGTGQITASFSKGVMRFVGGKLSKNDGGVTVDTPAGALAIRGGIAFADFKSPKNFSVLFVFGDYIKLQGQTVFQPGYGLFSNNGVVTNRPFNATDVAGIMAALANGNPATGNPPSGSSNPSTVFKLVNTQSLNQLISDANTTMIVDQAQKTDTQTETETCSDCEGTPPGHLQGYAGGLYVQTPNPHEEENESNVGVLANWNSKHVDFAFNPNEDGTFYTDDGTFSALFKLRVGMPGGNQGGADILFGDKTSNPDTRFSFINGDGGGLLAFAPPNGVTIFHDDGQVSTPGQLPSFAALVSGDFFSDLYDSYGGNEGEQSLAYVPHNYPQPIEVPELCSDCDFLKWGGFVTVASFMETTDDLEPVTFERDVAVLGWWVAGDIPPVGQLPLTGGATYAGTAIGTVATDLFDGQSIYVATGDLGMNWNFGTRSGDLTISSFDASHFPDNGGLSFTGAMCAPGVTSCGGTATPAGNHFGGPLSGQLPNLEPEIDRNLNGFALGSFARGPDNFDVNNVAINRSIPQGVIGNWGVGNDRYMASGVFAGSQLPQ